jgi:DNA polymerase-3 subunit chi
VPEDGFLAHTLTDFPSSEWIVITTEQNMNLNQAYRLMNLCPQPIKQPSLFAEVYELFDETHPQKLESTKLRLQAYQQIGLKITTL